MNKKDSLIALSIFSGLYDEDQDIYSVLSEFIVIALKTNLTLSQVTPEGLSQEIYKQFAFRVPISVVKRACKRLVEQNNYLDVINNQKETYQVRVKLKNEAVETRRKIQDISDSYTTFFNELKLFIETQKQTCIQPLQEAQLLSEFYNYLIDNNHSGDYIPFISAFIIDNKGTEKGRQIEELVKGAALYNGLQFTTEDEDFSTNWRKPFTIFLSTEIVFDILNLNGEFYEKYATDLIGLVSEVNYKKKLITLSISERVKEEFDRFFIAATHVVKHNTPLELEKVAMRKIKSDCSTPADVIQLKAKLEVKLFNFGITTHKDTKSYKNSDVINGNIDSSDLRKQLSSGIDRELDLELEKKVDGIMSDLNEIQYLRGKIQFKNLESSKAILLSRDSITAKADKLTQIPDDECFVPLCTTYDILINRIWFKTSALHSASKKLPITFDILARSQFSLNNVLKKSADKVCEKIISIIKSPDISEENRMVAEKSLKEIKDRELRREEGNDAGIDNVIDSLLLTESPYEEISRRLELKDQENAQAFLEKDNKIIMLLQGELKRHFDAQDQLESEQVKLIEQIDSIKKDNVYLRYIYVVAVTVIISLVFLAAHAPIWTLILNYNLIAVVSQNLFDAMYYSLLGVISISVLKIVRTIGKYRQSMKLANLSDRLVKINQSLDSLNNEISNTQLELDTYLDK